MLAPALTVVTLTLALGCQKAGPPAVAVKVAAIPEVGTPGAFLDAIALSPDGARVATGERGGAIRVWLPGASAEPLRLGAYRQAIADLAFSPDGTLLASIGRHRESTLRLWQDDGAGGWTEAAAIPIGRCVALRFAAKGAHLAVMCEDEVLVLDVATRQETWRLTRPHAEALTAFDLAADGSRLLTAGHEGTVTVWELARKCMWIVTRSTGPPHGSLRFGEDGRLLAPTGDRMGFHLLDVPRKGRKDSRVLVAGAKAFHAVSVTDDASRFAVLTSTLGDRQLVYDVDVWLVDAPRRRAR